MSKHLQVGDAAGGTLAGTYPDPTLSPSVTFAESQVVGLVGDLAAKAPLASPAFTGTPTAPTATLGTNTTQLATTAFVVANAGAGSVTSVGVSGGTTGLTTSGGPVTSSGTITLSGTLALANGGTGATSASAARTSLGVPNIAGDTFTGAVNITGSADAHQLVIKGNSTQTNNLLRLTNSSNTLVASIDNSGQYRTGNVIPLANTTYTCGSPSNYWSITYSQKLFLGSTANIDGSTAGQISFTGSIAKSYAAKTSTYTITSTDHTIDCTSGTFTVTLPTAASITGRMYIIKNSGTGVITIATTSSQTIDGATSYTLGTQYGSITVQSNGTNWIVI